LYDQLKTAAKGKPIATQRTMFPVTLELAPADAVILQFPFQSLGRFVAFV
jgi:DNA mismatch repair protein MutL